MSPDRHSTPIDSDFELFILRFTILNSMLNPTNSLYDIARALYGLAGLVKKNLHNERLIAILAFAIPFFVRSVPEIIAWPYPIGFDTMNYAYWILDKHVLDMSFQVFFKSTNLFIFIVTLVDGILGLNVLLLMKILGPLLSGLLGLSLYFFARRVLGWKTLKSLLAVFMATGYFVSLRISWDLYRQILGTSFMLIAIIEYKSSKNRLGYSLSGVFSILTVLTHELPSVVLLSFILFECFRAFAKKDFREARRILVSQATAACFFFYQIYDVSTNSLVIPTEYVAQTLSPPIDRYYSRFSRVLLRISSTNCGHRSLQPKRTFHTHLDRCWTNSYDPTICLSCNFNNALVALVHISCVSVMLTVRRRIREDYEFHAKRNSGIRV